jgi:transglutaminase-like putative cysteine protease
MKLNRPFAGAALAAAGFTLFVAGFLLGDRRPDPLPDFHDTRVNHIPSYTSLVDPRHPDIRALARELKTPEQAYYFVRDAIVFDPSVPAAQPEETLARGVGSCLGKATLLCSLYRAMGLGADEVHVVTGDVAAEGDSAKHAWLNVDIDGRHLQQDPTELVGLFRFAEFPDGEYTRAFVQDESFCFNDRGFAVVSQLNRFRGGFPPGMPPLPGGDRPPPP